MTRNNILFFLIFVAILIVACEKDIASKSKTLWDEVLVKITINSLKNSSATSSEKSLTFVYGKLEMKGKNDTIKTADLECIILEIDEMQSEKLYIDSVAHVLPSNYPANNNMISVNVYWKFDNPISHNSLKKFNYIPGDSEMQKCVSFK